MNAVIITGCAGGIGQALVEEYQSSGYFTVGLDIKDAKNADANINVDLAALAKGEKSEKELKDEIDQVLDGYTLKTLVNNAAAQILGDIEHIKLEEFRKTIDINLTAPFILTKILYERLKKSNGSVINIGSIHSKLTKPKFISYATSKAALSGLTQAMAVDFGKYVRVNIIQPAAIMTDMLVEGFKDNPEKLKQLESYHPAGIVGNPRDVAKLAVYLSSDDAKFINGAVLGIDGAIAARLHDPE